MNYESQKVAKKKIIYEVEYIGNIEHFETCEEIADEQFRLFIKMMTLAMWQVDQKFRAMYCVKEKPIVQQGKTHADVELPNLNGAAKEAVGKQG